MVKPEGTKPHGRLMRISEHDIKDDFTRRRMGCGSGYEQVVGSSKHGNEP
jgi:hypothetical protein